MTINTRNYGDLPQLQQDIKTLTDIFNRQGASLMVDSLAEQVATSLSKFSLDDADRTRAATAVVNDLKEQLSERI